MKLSVCALTLIVWRLVKALRSFLCAHLIPINIYKSCRPCCLCTILFGKFYVCSLFAVIFSFTVIWCFFWCHIAKNRINRRQKSSRKSHKYKYTQKPQFGRNIFQRTLRILRSYNFLTNIPLSESLVHWIIQPSSELHFSCSVEE